MLDPKASTGSSLLVVALLVQFFLAGAGVFRADGGAARDSSAFDPHRANGMVIQGSRSLY